MPATPRKIPVFLVDDQETVRRGLKMRLQIESDFEVVGEAADGRVAAFVADLRPDVVVMDVAMPVMNGITGAAALGEARLPVAVVMLSLYDDAETRGRASAAGGRHTVLIVARDGEGLSASRFWSFKAAR